MSAGQTKRGLDLIRLSWGYMLNYKQSTNSTFWECAWPRLPQSRPFAPLLALRGLKAVRCARVD